MKTQILYTCPACGYKTKATDYFGSFELCPVCDWEDDSVQLHNPASGGGANKMSLIEAQKEFLAKKIEHGDFKKDPAWRPLNQEEITKAQKETQEKHWAHAGDTEYSTAYWV